MKETKEDSKLLLIYVAIGTVVAIITAYFLYQDCTSARGKLNLLSITARNAGIRLYLIVDEYDNFTNVVLSERGKEIYKNCQ